MCENNVIKIGGKLHNSSTLSNRDLTPFCANCLKLLIPKIPIYSGIKLALYSLLRKRYFLFSPVPYFPIYFKILLKLQARQMCCRYHINRITVNI